MYFYLYDYFTDRWHTHLSDKAGLHFRNCSRILMHEIILPKQPSEKQILWLANVQVTQRIDGTDKLPRPPNGIKVNDSIEVQLI